MHTSILLICFDWISWKNADHYCKIFFFTKLVLNCFAGISHNEPWGYKKAIQRLRCANVLQLQNIWQILIFWTFLFYCAYQDRQESDGFVLAELPFMEVFVSFTIFKKSLSKRPFTTNNTISMSIIILTLYLLYHSFRHHF